jgi:hypothetical protein
MSRRRCAHRRVRGAHSEQSSTMRMDMSAVRTAMSRRRCAWMCMSTMRTASSRPRCAWGPSLTSSRPRCCTHDAASTMLHPHLSAMQHPRLSTMQHPRLPTDAASWTNADAASWTNADAASRLSTIALTTESNRLFSYRGLPLVYMHSPRLGAIPYPPYVCIRLSTVLSVIPLSLPLSVSA